MNDPMEGNLALNPLTLDFERYIVQRRRIRYLQQQLDLLAKVSHDATTTEY